MGVGTLESNVFTTLKQFDNESDEHRVGCIGRGREEGRQAARGREGEGRAAAQEDLLAPSDGALRAVGSNASGRAAGGAGGGGGDCSAVRGREGESE